MALDFIIRLDGVGFSRLSRKYFTRPYDTKFSEGMCAALNLLMTNKFFRPAFGYTGSDEISLYFPNSSHHFDGNPEKYVSILAAMASTKFTLVTGVESWFDGRVIRDLYDTYFEKRMWSVSNNFINDLWHHHKRGHPNTPIGDKIKMLLDSGIDIPPTRRFGYMAYRTPVVKGNIVRTTVTLTPVVQPSLLQDALKELTPPT